MDLIGRSSRGNGLLIMCLLKDEIVVRGVVRKDEFYMD